MIFLILFVLSVLLMMAFAPIAKKTKIPLVLFFILFGILFSTYGIYDLFYEIDKVNTNVPELATLATFAVVT